MKQNKLSRDIEDTLSYSPKSSCSFHCRLCISSATFAAICSSLVHAIRVRKRNRTLFRTCTSPDELQRASPSPRDHNPPQDTSEASGCTERFISYNKQHRQRAINNLNKKSYVAIEDGCISISYDPRRVQKKNAKRNE